jgi:peptidyl-prolyl cis-trans isomerase D
MIEAAARHADEQRDARYFVVKAQASELAQPGEQDIKKFYDENPVNYTATEYRSIALLYVEPSDLAPSIKLTDEEIKAGYDKYKSEYFSPERRTLLQTTFPSVEEAAKAKERIRSDADFLAIAKERGLSDQDATWADRTKADILDPKIADAAFALKQGELSNPVEGQLAVMLLKAVKITPEHQQTFDEARDAIAKRLRLEKAGEAIRSIYDTVEEGRAAQTPFEELAKISNIGFMLVPAIDAKGRDKDGKDVSLPHRSDVLKLAFQTDVGVENDAFATKEDGLIWYEVREVVPSQVKPFDTVKEQVKADWTARKIRDLAIDKARKLAERANAGASLEDLARESGSEVKTSQGLKRSTASQDFDGPAVTALFSVPPGGVTFAPEADGQGAKVIQSQAVLAPPFDPKSAEADEIRKPASQAAGLDLLGSYLANLQNQLGITVNETLWRQITGAPQQ